MVFRSLQWENDTAIQGELTDTISYDGVNEKPEEAFNRYRGEFPESGDTRDRRTCRSGRNSGRDSRIAGESESRTAGGIRMVS